MHTWIYSVEMESCSFYELLRHVGVYWNTQVEPNKVIKHIGYVHIVTLTIIWLNVQNKPKIYDVIVLHMGQFRIPPLISVRIE